MVSRQETSRALLTPGEVMQLPADQAIVMLSGAKPIRATKARYFADPQLAARVLTPPKEDSKDTIANQGLLLLLPAPANSVAAASAGSADADPDNGGIRREPGLRAPEEVERQLEPEAVADLAPEETESRDAVKKRLVELARTQARQASLDRDEDMGFS
jgi:type IV secretion system protein VirD4